MRLADWPISVWMLWSMLGVGVVLTIVSLWQTSERFWHWKRARQIHQGEIVPATSALRSGQALVFVASGTLPDARTVDYVAYVLSIKHNALLFALESASVAHNQNTKLTQTVPAVGEALHLQVTGSGGLYRFTALARNIHSDPDMPGRWLITVALPFWVARVQRREHARAAVQVGITLRPNSIYHRVDTASPGAETLTAETPSTEMLRGMLLDLSGGGLRLELAGGYSPHTVARLIEKFAVGALWEVELDLPLLRAAPLRLNIRSCQRVAARGGIGICVRGAFAPLPALQQDTVISYVFQAQREQLRQVPCST